MNEIGSGIMVLIYKREPLIEASSNLSQSKMFKIHSEVIRDLQKQDP